ncbi:MAG: hypothetical protein HDR95_05080 [Bacteroides sp.]|nr:hypothetical protein [Bacteroides sp.]
MRQRNGYLIDYAVPICWNFLPIMMFAAYIFSCIWPGTEDGTYSISNFLIMMSMAYGLAIVVTFFAFISVCRNKSIKSFWTIIKPEIIRGGIILAGATLIFGVIALSLLDVFNEGGLNIIRLFLMIGGPIIIGMFTLFCISSVED